MNLARSIALVAILATVSGCGSIGEGSTVKSLQILASGSGSAASPFLLHQCLRDQLIAVATFTDGTTADFSYRVTWASSDSSVVQVSDNDIPTAVVSGGVFAEAAYAPYRPGTLIPRAASGSATITATFVGISASMLVDIDTAQFKVAPLAPAVDPQVQPPALRYVGPGAAVRYVFLAVRPDRQTVTFSPLALTGSLNPILWTFVGGELDPADSAVAGDYDKYAVPNAAAPTAVISARSGGVTGMTPDAATTWQVQAATSLCPTDAAFLPTAPVRIAPFDATNPLTLGYENDFNGEGQPLTGDLVAGSTELLSVTANLDSDGDGIGDQTQNLSDQIDLQITHTTACASGSTNCTCDADGTNCTKRLFLSSVNEVRTLISNDSANADLIACFTDLDSVHSDDCEEDAAGDDVALKSNTLSLQAIAVDLRGTGSSLFIRPDSASQPAFTYPGQQFNAYGTFTAMDGGTPFAGGTSATATQKVTRHVAWTTRPQGSTTEFSDIALVRNVDDGFFGGIGSVNYLKDVTVNTALDVLIAPVVPFASVPAPAAPTPFTVCPSAGC